MNRHLSPQEFVEALEDSLGLSRVEHLDACDACRAELSSLHALMSDVKATGNQPEPSPLFWDHFSERVRRATSVEPLPADRSWWAGLWRPLGALGAVAALVALAVMVRSAAIDDRSTRDVASRAVAGADPTAEAISFNDESSLAFMAAAASNLSWEEARASDLAPKPVAVDLAIGQLTGAQRAELVRLIREEMRTGEVE